MSIEPGVSEVLARERASRLTDITYRLALSVPSEPAADVTGTMSIEFSQGDTGQPLQLDFRALPDQVLAVSANGKTTSYAVRDEHVVIPGASLQSGQNSVTLDFIAGAAALNRNPDFLYTLFVPDRARTVFPLFDQPDLKARWVLSLELPSSWTALSSAAIARTDAHDVRKSVHFAMSDLMSSYLFSFVAGEFKTHSEMVAGKEMRVYHRQNDEAMVSRNIDEIVRLHAEAIAWLESYTGIDYPFQQRDIVLIPAHPYGGMEHVGAIQYRAESLWLDENASDSELLNRASLIAHETAHMWFGNLVTMRWFDDVWTKEVFANFMAAKIVNPSFPGINHDLQFLVRHHPRAYSIDRTAGANAIRQPLPNLNQAGQLYGSIIYNKAPIMMRQLEMLLGQDAFQNGIRQYLTQSAYANASWPDLIRVFDALTNVDVAGWSSVWVNTPGRPAFSLTQSDPSPALVQTDPMAKGRIWPQTFGVQLLKDKALSSYEVEFAGASETLNQELVTHSDQLLLNSDGLGYGLFDASLGHLEHWPQLTDLSRASLLVNLYEQMLESGQPTPDEYAKALIQRVKETDNQLLLRLALRYLTRTYWTLLPDASRLGLSVMLEQALWDELITAAQPSVRKLFFDAYTSVADSSKSLDRLEDIWRGSTTVEGLVLSERDMITLAISLAIKRPASARDIVDTQLQRIESADEKRRFRFIAPALSADAAVRDAVFDSFKQAENRQTESWVLDALWALHHPLRVAHSEKYVLPSLELLEEIQATGDIFFPAGWLGTTLRNHHSACVLQTVDTFLARRPDYNPQLRLKLLQAVDPVKRSHRLRGEGSAAGC